MSVQEQVATTDPASPEPEGPRSMIGHYVAVMGAFAAGIAGASTLAVRRDPSGTGLAPGWSDLALIGLATHRVSRLVSKNRITTPLRAPFTDHEGAAGPGEVNDVPVTTGWRRGVGELVSCPFCLDVWIATTFTFGRVLAPRATRAALSVSAAMAIADFLHFGYVVAEHRAES